GVAGGAVGLGGAGVGGGVDGGGGRAGQVVVVVAGAGGFGGGRLGPRGTAGWGGRHRGVLRRPRRWWDRQVGGERYLRHPRSRMNPEYRWWRRDPMMNSGQNPGQLRLYARDGWFRP